MQIDQQLSQDVEKTIFPLKLIWLALLGTLLIYVLMIYQVRGISFIDLKDNGDLKNILIPFSFVPFLFSFFIFSKKEWLLKKFFVKKNAGNAPYLKTMSEEDRKYLAEFSPYLVFHILVWTLNEAGAILAFVVSFTSGNISYYLLSGSIAFLLNFLCFKPNYKNFKQRLG